MLCGIHFRLVYYMTVDDQRMRVICGQVLLLSPGHSSKSESWQPFSTLCSCGVGNDRRAHGLFLGCILFFGDFHFCFYAKPWTSQSVTYHLIYLSAQLGRMFQLSLHRYSC